MPTNDRGMTSNERAVDRKIDTAAWGSFLLWVGISLLAKVGWGVGLIGAGVITLAAQAWRNHVGLNADRFSLVVGVLFAAVGVWNIFDVRVDVVPLLFIGAGIALLASTWRRPHGTGRPTSVDAPANRPV